MNKITLITGATSGIGKACALHFAQNRHDLILTGRRTERLQELMTALQKEHPVRVHTLAFDIRDRRTTETAIASLPAQWKNIEILVNNAGLASGLNTVQDGLTDDWEKMIDTNIKGLLYVSRAVLPFMIARGKGHVINIGSIAGKEVYPNGNVYCATKFAVDALTKGMRIDLVQHGIKVTQIAPGAVETEFSVVRFHGDKQRAKGVYQGFQPLRAEDVAEVVYYATTLPRHANINDLVLMPTSQASAAIVHKV
ncbi:MAG: SDR family oxidoreductase [Bacteroidales bacterium]|nr:SDR family oxidoreductase [Bacteroidales bacterium]